MNDQGIKTAFLAAFPYTVPILAGFLFLGMTYGVYMNVLGFSFVYPLLMSLCIYAGSMEFVAAGLLLGAFQPVQALALTLMINARYLFYGLAMLDKFRDTGLKKIYLIFGMCDETFSVNCAATVPPGVDKGWFYFFVTLLNQMYWVAGATLGGLLGPFIPLNTTGLDFVMTAMFVVIFLEQWRKEPKKRNCLLGLGITLVCRLVFGPDSFLIPAMLCLLLALTLLRRQGEGGEAQ